MENNLLVLVCSCRDIILDILKTGDEIHGRLLVTSGWRLQVCQCALELQSRVVVVNEPQCDGIIERHTAEALKGIGGIEIHVSLLPVSSIRLGWYSSFARASPSLTRSIMSPHIVLTAASALEVVVSFCRRTG
jgi:hypothetical protein